MNKKQWILLSGCLILSLLFMFPYLSNELSLEHDTLFHLSRIEGLAQSFQSGKLIPDLYPLKNDGFGYASALFYCDFFLAPAALLYHAGLDVAVCYKITVFLATLISALTMSYLLIKTKHSIVSALLGTALYLFCNYRITDVYVRGALGEVIAMAFIPLILLGTYEILFENKSKSASLIIGFTSVALSHNLTLLLCVIGFASLILFNIKYLTTKKVLTIAKSALICIGLSAWFLFPTLEHTSFQDYYLHYYASSSDLASHSLASWQYLINETIFGLSGNHRAVDQAMVVTPGILLLFLPVLFLFDIRKEKEKIDKFAGTCCIIGYLFAFFCSSLVPWNKLFFLRILQFPWRLMTLSCPLLAFASAHILHQLDKKELAMTGLLALTMLNGAYLLTPCLNRPTVIYNSTSYEELLSGSIVDPYYANTPYNRIEVAGADYLPIGFLDYKNASHCITDLSGNEIGYGIQKDDSLTFTAPKHTEIIVPLTAYKGYHVYSDNEEIPWTTVQGRISFNTGNHTEFTILYEKTMIHKGSIVVSMITLLVYLVFKKKSR